MKLLFLDTETGGLDAQKYSLLTVALVVYDSIDRRIYDEAEFAVKHDNYVVTPEAMKINNINLEEHDKIAVDGKIVVQKIIEFIKKNFGDERAVIVGHNPSFDYDFLDKLFKDENEYLSLYMSHRKIDTCAILNFYKAIERIDIESASLEAGIRYFNIETKARHTAMDDVKATIALFEKLQMYIND